MKMPDSYVSCGAKLKNSRWRPALRAAVIVASVCSLQSISSGDVAAVFEVNEGASTLSVTATAQISIFTVSDDDQQSLGGTIDATFDFGSTGVFPPSAAFEVTSAAITHLEPYQFELGRPPLSANVSLNDAVVDVTTPAPPAALTLTADAGVVYEFDAAEFEISIIAGMAAVTGVFEDSLDFAETPATGMADPGTLGQLTLMTTPGGGSEMLVDARLELPIDFIEVADFQGVAVTLDVEGMVVAHSSFSVDLSDGDLPGDFDNSGFVDGSDFLAWQRGETDDPLSASELQAWQTNFGNAAQHKIANAAPEPATIVMLAIGALALGNLGARGGKPCTNGLVRDSAGCANVLIS